MKRLPVAAGNWKMNTTVDEAVALAKELREKLDRLNGVENIIFPPFVSLSSVKTVITGSSIKLGAQNVHYAEKGAFTGEVSTSMLYGLCDYIILGHSERRQLFHEDSSTVNRKVKSVLSTGLTPVMCVGERLEEKEEGCTEAVITGQVREGLAGISETRGLIIAYEPVWAIGTGKAASGLQANETIGLIRRLIASQYGEVVANGLRILYGGSVNAANIAEFVSQPEVDGSLVGGASLNPKDFAAIAEQTARAKLAT